MQKAAKAVAAGPMRAYEFDAQKLRAQVFGDTLIIEVREEPLPGPLVTQEVRQALLDRGLGAMEVDCLVDSWYDEVQCKLLSKIMLAARK